jgi:hypothetical protein
LFIEILFSLLSSFTDISLVDDAVSIKHRVRLVANDAPDRRSRNAGTVHVPHRASPQIVESQPTDIC